jgi:heme-degrading monooxygenase HmoA
MIIEIAEFDVLPGKEQLFAEASKSASKVIAQSVGFISVEFNQCLEKPSRFLTFIIWQTLEDHTIGFRQSSLFTEWRAILSPFFNSAPVALHYNKV